MNTHRILCMITALTALVACAPEPQKGESQEADTKSESESPCAFHFENEAARAGLDFVHFDSPRAALLPEDNGSGLAFADYDNDGFDDLYVVNLAGPVLLERNTLVDSRPPGRLFHNQADGTFQDVTKETGLNHVGWDMAAVWADLDGDGWLDLVLTGIDEVLLYRNLEGTGFEDVSPAAGLGEVDCLASGPAVADYDADGDLDLYVPCYVAFPWERARNRTIVGGRPATMTTPANYPPQSNLLFRNDGQGRFDDVAAEAGVADETGRGLQAVFADLDGDGRPDLYVGNDQSFDRLYRNLGDGTFEDSGLLAGTHDPRASMGITVGDYDGDGAPDLFLTHWVGEENALYRNLSEEGVLLFEDVTRAQGLAPVDTSWVSWGSGWFDFDLDSDLDLFMVNGSTIEDEWTLEVLSNPKMIPQPLAVYERREDRYFDVSACAGESLTINQVGRGSTFSDYDRDGLVDVAVQVHNGSPLLLRNTSATQGHWLEINLLGEEPNHWGVGAQITVTTSDRILKRQQLAGGSYLGSDSPTLHFGLGAVVEVSEVEVRWPSGQITRSGLIPADRRVKLSAEADGWQEVSSSPTPPSPWRQGASR
jgi:hypothetical protein